MMQQLHDKSQIENFFRKSTALHLYEIGDLDDNYYENTTWFGWLVDGHICAIVLIYNIDAFELPILLAMALTDQHHLTSLLNSSKSILPPKFNAHFGFNGYGFHSIFPKSSNIELHAKYMLDPSTTVKSSPLPKQLTSKDVPDMIAFYKAAFPESEFDPRAVENGSYFGIWDNGWVSIAGAHILSINYKVASLGNIATLPQYRNKDYASKSCSACILYLRNLGIENIGLNVKLENKAAINCYERIGFTKIAEYTECKVINGFD